MSDCLFFGCWNEPGHYLVGPGGYSVYKELGDRPSYYGAQRHLDGTLAPRKEKYTGKIVWSGQASQDRRHEVEYRSEECPQGQFLLHVLDNGYTAIQWWDRCQGDKRGACNSTVLLKGVHDSATMIAAAREHFPHVIENLKKAGIELVEVKVTP